MEAWKRKRWSRNVGALDVVGRGRLCAICRGGDHHEEHCEEAPEPLHERVSATAVFGTLCYNRGKQVKGEEHLAYVAEQAQRTAKIAKAQQMVVAQTQIKYVDRIKTVYVKGETIEKQVPIYVTSADAFRFAVNAGFVRLYDAVWSGEDPGPATDSDREPAGISLAQVAEADASNATSCRAWRELAQGLREQYLLLQSVTNANMQ